MAKGIGYRRPKKSSSNRQGERVDLARRSIPSRSNRNVNYVEDDDVDADVDDVVVVDLAAAPPSIDKAKATRVMIACMFEREFVQVNKDVVLNIRKRCKLGPKYKVKEVLEDYLLYRALGLAYQGDRVGMITNDSIGRPPVLETDSVEAQLVADALENGVSAKLAHVIVNVHRQEDNLDPVSFSAIYGLIRRMKPLTQRVAVHRQGSCDVGSKWARARFLWCVQLLVRYGEIDFDGDTPAGLECLSDYYDGTKPIPDYWNKTKLTPLSPYQQADWDEAHRQCTPGEGLGSSQKTTRVIFPRDADGKVDLNGEYSKEQVTMMKVKYNEETRKAFGVAMVRPIDSDGIELEVVGRRLKPFDYTGKTIKSIKDYAYLIEREIQRVKSLSNGGPWFIKGRQKGKVYADDDLTAIKNIAKALATKLKENGIADVHQLSQLTYDDVKNMNIQGISKGRLFSWIHYAQENYIDSNAPADTDYRKEANPYKARFGNRWMEEISVSVTLKPFVCVTTLIQHVYDETKRAI